MTMYEIPAETFRDLLLNIEGTIHPASPFAFLVAGDFDAPLQPHVPWLKEQGYLGSPPDQNGRVALVPPLRRSLSIVARPKRRVTVGEVRPDGTRRAVYVSDGIEVTVAMFDQENCIVSDPVGIEEFHSGLVDAIGVNPEAVAESQPLQIDPAGLTLLGVLVGPAGPEDETSLSGEAGPEGISWPVERSDAQARLTEVLGEEELAGALMDSFLTDNILSEEEGKLTIHDKFQEWHQALISGHILELQRAEYPEGRLEDAPLPTKAYFFGPPGARVLMWPAGDASGEILLSKPTEQELSSVVGYLVGYIVE